MKEYIEREKAVEMIKNYGKNAINDRLKTLDPVDDIVLLAKFVDLIPAADVVEVVRCKDCVYLRESEKTNRVFCLYHGDDYEFETHLNKYCSDGVKAKLKEREGK